MKKLIILIILASFTLSACLFMPVVSGEKENVRYREEYDPF
jgi:hypothetical protein